MFCCFPEIVVSVSGLNLLGALTVRGIKMGSGDCTKVMYCSNIQFHYHVAFQLRQAICQACLNWQTYHTWDLEFKQAACNLNKITCKLWRDSIGIPNTPYTFFSV